MRVSLAVAALVGLTLTVPGLQAQDALVVDAKENHLVTADLFRDREGSLLFRLNEPDFPAGNAGPLQSAFVRLEREGEAPSDLALQRSGTVWSAGLAIATPDLVAGSWTASFFGVRATGGTLIAERGFDITSADRTAPLLRLAQPASPVLVGPGDFVGLTVSDPLLRRVTVHFGGLPQPLLLAHPYALDGDLFPEGQTRVTVVASDRAGHDSTLAVDLLRDSVAPTLELVIPEHAYANAPFALQAVVVETGPYTLRIDANGTTKEVLVVGSVAQGVNRTSELPLLPLSNGTLDVKVEVIDRVGSSAFQAFGLPIEAPIVDVEASALRVEGPQPLFAQHPVRINATIGQVGGVTTLPIPVTFSGAGKTASFVTNVGPAQSKGVTWNVTLPAGRHEVVASAGIPAGANETAFGNENATLAIEVFLGQAVAGSKNYNIRADEQGLPQSAVEDGASGSAPSYPLTLVNVDDCQPGRPCGVVYEFTLDGNRTVRWDPLEPLPAARPGTDDEPPSSSSSTGADGNDAPFPGLVMVLLVVALAAMVQRRK